MFHTWNKQFQITENSIYTKVMTLGNSSTSGFLSLIIKRSFLCFHISYRLTMEIVVLIWISFRQLPINSLSSPHYLESIYCRIIILTIIFQQGDELDPTVYSVYDNSHKGVSLVRACVSLITDKTVYWQTFYITRA